MKTPLIINGEPTPKPKGSQECSLCKPPKFFANWDLLGAHITIVHNENGRKRSFYNGSPPLEILNHPDWNGFEEENR